MKYSGIEWIGEIPEDWRTLPLKRLIKNHFSGCWGEEADREDFNALCIRIADFNFNDQTIKLTASTIRSYSKTQLDKGVLSDGDLLLEKSGGGDKTPVGRTVIFRQKDFPDKTMFANFCECLRLVDSVCKKYVAYVLKALYISCDMRCFFYQTTGLQNIDLKVFLSTILCLPNGATQHKIANFLDVKCAEIDKLIANQQGQIDKLKEYKQSVITEAVTKGLDPSVPMKDSGVEWIGSIPEEWKIFTIGTLFSYRNEKVSDKVFPPLSVSKRGVVPQIETVAKTDSGDNRKKVLSGDFVINSRSDRKQSCGLSKLNGSVSLINIVLTIRNKSILLDYTKWLLKNYGFADEFYRWGHGIVSDLWTTTWQEMKSILLPIPTIREQQQIADYLDDKCGKIDQLIAIKQQKIDKLQQYKKSLIYEYVTGKKEVI